MPDIQPTVDEILSLLARDLDVDVRLWVAASAREILGNGATKVLQSLARNRHPGVAQGMDRTGGDTRHSLGPLRAPGDRIGQRNDWSGRRRPARWPIVHRVIVRAN